ncbi:MAG: Kelch repeat-containing protein [Nitrospirota bacterium]
MKPRNRIRGFVMVSAAAATPVFSLALVALSLFGKAAWLPSQSKMLTFAERVKYQRAIEEVYWRHRIWPRENGKPKPSLDSVMSQADIQNKVKAYLRESQLLDYWQRPIQSQELRCEMERMAQHTEQPEILRELFDALGNDPYVIAECLARPVLADRFLSERSVIGARTERVAPERAEPELPAHPTFMGHEQDPLESRLGATDTEQSSATMATSSIQYTLPTITQPSACTLNAWTATTTTNAPSARASHSAVWTGSEMIVWGGQNGNQGFNNGARYNPSTDSWRSISSPGALTGGRAVWTGTEMIVWGGNSGQRYNPFTNTWRSVSTTNAPSYRGNHTAVWTGTEMVVWGGVDPFGFALNTGGKYNPNTNSWTPTSTTNAPAARSQQTAVWTGSEMIVWGGLDYFGAFGVRTGGRYNPTTDSWTATSISNAPTARHQHTAVWTGREMIVWGGGSQSGVFNTGGRYNPATNSWTTTSITNTPSGRAWHTALWTGSKMIVWGGFTASGATNTGGRYNPIADSWAATTTTGAPSARADHTAIWTGSQLIVWGGEAIFPAGLNTGGRYCAESLGSQLSNISTRSFVQTGDNVMIGGFIVEGAQTKRLIIRAIGPELTHYGVANALTDTVLELHDRTGALIASNDNWRTTIVGGIITTNQVSDITNSGYPPTDGRESAIVADLAPGNYTAIVRGVNNATGVALVEVYDLSNDGSSILGNISTRSFVQTDNNVMIGGFIVQGTGSNKVVIRAIGPELGQYGVPNPLANPRLELHNAAGALIGSNDDWQHTIIGGVITHSQVVDIQNSGHAPTDASESAIIAELPPGNYTAIVRGVNSTTGVALVEVYDLNR